MNDADNARRAGPVGTVSADEPVTGADPSSCSRRHAIATLGALAISLPAGFARGAEWPERPIKVLVGYPAGGANDLVARAVSARLADALGQSIVVENRTGAAGTIAAEVAARATPDGYTLYMMSSAQVLAPSIRKDVPFDPVKDYRPMALCASAPYFLAVHKSVPVKTVAEFVALARSKPRTLNYASSGIGAGPHLTTSLFMSVAGIELNHVPYRGDADALVDLSAGRVESAFMSVSATLPHIQSGSLRALAISSLERSSILPDVPTVAESGYPGFQMDAWWGLVGQARVPDEVVRKVAGAVLPILGSAPFVAQFAAQGITPGRLGPEAFARRIAEDFVKFADIVKRAGIQPS